MILLKNGQICFTEKETHLYGEQMKDALVDVKTILSGNIMVYYRDGHKCYFETREPLEAPYLSDISVVPHEAGSIMYSNLDMLTYSITFFYEFCRFPTVEEFKIYEEYSKL